MNRSLILILCGLILAACAGQTTPVNANPGLTEAAATVARQMTDTAVRTAAAATALSMLNNMATETNTPQPVLTATLSPDEAIVHTAAAATALVRLTEMASGITNTPQPSSTPEPSATPMPTMAAQAQLPAEAYINPAKAPEILRPALKLKTLPSLNEHNLKKVTGWSQGFESFEWMDSAHLLLSPIIGQQGGPGGGGSLPLSYAAVINLNSGKVWIPTPKNVYDDPSRRLLPRWSAQLEMLLAAKEEKVVGVYTPDGELVKTYPGNLFGVSPSATKLMLGNIWTDLITGKEVAFDWGEGWNHGNEDPIFQTIWSPDETRVYDCCYVYGDINGDSFKIPPVILSGKEKGEFYPQHSSGKWIFDGTYMLPGWNFFWDGYHDIVPLFDPQAKAYRNLNAVAGVPSDAYCNIASAPKNGKYVWLGCSGGDYLVNLTAFTSQAYPACVEADIEWSNNGKYLWAKCSDGGHLIELATFKTLDYPSDTGLYWSTDANFARFSFNGDPVPEIFSGFAQALKPMPVNPDYSLWHPQQNILVYLSNQGKILSVLDAATMSVQKETTLKASFRGLLWKPDGKQLVLVGKDNSFWQIDYPSLENLKQISSAVPDFDISSVSWSPDATSLAFQLDKEIYIVELDTQP